MTRERVFPADEQVGSAGHAKHLGPIGSGCLERNKAQSLLIRGIPVHSNSQGKTLSRHRTLWVR